MHAIDFWTPLRWLCLAGWVGCSAGAESPAIRGADADGSRGVEGPATSGSSATASGGSSSARAGGSGSAGTAGDRATGTGGASGSGSAPSGNASGTAGTSDGSRTTGGTSDGGGKGGSTSDGARGGDTGDGQGGGSTGDGARGGDTGDGARGGDTGDGARGGGTGDGCTPSCFPSVLDFVNVIVLNDAHAEGADVEGRMYVAHDAHFPNYAIGTRMSPDPVRPDLVVGNNLYFGGGAVPNGRISYAGVLELGLASTLGGYHNETVIDFAAVEVQMTQDSAALRDLPPNGTASAGMTARFTGTDPALNVFEVQGEALFTMSTMIISAPESSTVLVNIRGTTVRLENFGFVLEGVSREHILYNLPEATSLTMSGVGIQGSVLAPYADLEFANGNIDGQLVVRDFNGSGESHPKYFVGCLPLCR